MRILALDVGDRRIGVAVSDDRTGVAIPLTVLEPSGDPVDAVAALLRQHRPDRLVIGLPLSLDGSLGPQGQRVRALAQAIAARVSIPVETWDERLTSVEASRRLRPHADARSGRPPRRGHGRGGKARRTPARRGAVDALAAAIILQAYLDSRPPPEADQPKADPGSQGLPGDSG